MNDLGYSVFETPLVCNYNWLFEDILSYLFDEEGVDLVYTYLYEKLTVSVEGEPIDVSTPEKLFDNLLIDYLNNE